RVDSCPGALCWHRRRWAEGAPALTGRGSVAAAAPLRARTSPWDTGLGFYHDVLGDPLGSSQSSIHGHSGALGQAVRHDPGRDGNTGPPAKYDEATSHFFNGPT